MPTYEYRCNACAKEFEYQQRMADDDLVTCEACGEPRLEKLISRTAFQLKGGGWYKDLYSSAPASPKEAAASASTTPAASASTPAAASAPAASTTPAPAASAPAASSGSSGGSSSGSSGSSTPSSSSAS